MTFLRTQAVNRGMREHDWRGLEHTTHDGVPYHLGCLRCQLIAGARMVGGLVEISWRRPDGTTTTGQRVPPCEVRDA